MLCPQFVHKPFHGITKLRIYGSVNINTSMVHLCYPRCISNTEFRIHYRNTCPNFIDNRKPGHHSTQTLIEFTKFRLMQRVLVYCPYIIKYL